MVKNLASKSMLSFKFDKDYRGQKSHLLRFEVNKLRIFLSGEIKIVREKSF